jgi:DNA polymerase
MGTTAPQTPALSREERIQRLREREEELQRCERCKLCPPGNDWANRLVYGVGSPVAEIVFVGEGPGEQEDIEGEPFVGRGGALLTKILQAMGLERHDVYICNVIKHRAPNNRDPERDEIDACEPFLLEQLDIIRPQVLVTLGNCATKTLLRTRTGITRLRGQWQTYHGIPTMPTYHPAYLLRSYTRANREAVWSDMRAVLSKLEELRVAR